MEVLKMGHVPNPWKAFKEDWPDNLSISRVAPRPTELPPDNSLDKKCVRFSENINTFENMKICHENIPSRKVDIGIKFKQDSTDTLPVFVAYVLDKNVRNCYLPNKANL